MELCNDGNDVAMALDTSLRQPFKVSAQGNQSGTIHSVAPDARRWVPEGRWMPRRCPATKSMPSGVLVLHVRSERMAAARRPARAAWRLPKWDVSRIAECAGWAVTIEMMVPGARITASLNTLSSAFC